MTNLKEQRMNNLKWILVVLLVSATIVSALTVKAESQATKLDVTAYPTTLNAGYNTSVAVTITNNFETIYDVGVDLQSQTTSTSPIVVGISNWRLDKIDISQNVTVRPLVFASADLAGNVYSMDLSISYKRLGYTSSSSETHTIGFYVQGEIDMVMYDFTVDPDPVGPGSTVSVAASVLNKGNVAAMFANVTMIPNSILTLKPESHSYLGEVDSNSPSPFTLEAVVNQDTKPGNYTIKLRVDYRDKESMIHTFEKDVTIHVEEVQKQQSQNVPVIGILATVVAISAAIVLAIVLVRRRSKKRSKSEDFQT